MQHKFSPIAWAAGTAFLLAACSSLPLYPEVLPSYSETFRAPYEAVWEATLRSLGIVPIKVADKAAGRIETEVYVFVFPVGKTTPPTAGTRRAALGSDNLILAQMGGGGARPTQAIWADLTIQVRPTGLDATQVAIQARVHNALLRGLYPGGYTNTPWADIFAKIRAQLGPDA